MKKKERGNDIPRGFNISFKEVKGKTPRTGQTLGRDKKNAGGQTSPPWKTTRSRKKIGR